MQLSQDIKGDVELLASIQDYAAKIRHATDPYDATARRRDLMDYIERICLRYNDGSFTDSMRNSVEELLSAALVMIRYSWTNEEGRKIFAEGPDAFPAIRRFCDANIDRLERIGEALDATQLNMFKWRAPAPRISSTLPGDRATSGYPAAA